MHNVVCNQIKIWPNKPRIWSPVHGVYLGEMATKRSPGPHLYATDWFYAWSHLGKRCIGSRFPRLLSGQLLHGKHDI